MSVVPRSVLKSIQCPKNSDKKQRPRCVFKLKRSKKREKDKASVSGGLRFQGNQDLNSEVQLLRKLYVKKRTRINHSRYLPRSRQRSSANSTGRERLRSGKGCPITPADRSHSWRPPGKRQNPMNRKRIDKAFAGGLLKTRLASDQPLDWYSLRKTSQGRARETFRTGRYSSSTSDRTETKRLAL